MAEQTSFRGERVVVTGGGGYFGQRLGSTLKCKGADVILFDISWPLEETAYEGMARFQGDVTHIGDIEKVLAHAKVDTVFHSASYGMSGREQLNREKIENVNVLGTKYIIEACQKYNVAHLVYTSTYNVVFGGQTLRNGDESLPYLPLDQHPDHYSRTKSIAEQTVLKANGSLLQDGNALKTCALRPAGIYGEGELRHLPRIVSYIEKGLFAFTYGQGDSVVDFVHVNNLVQAHLLAGKTLEDVNSSAAGQAYFISDDSPVNNFEFFRPLVEGLGYKFPRLKLPITLVYIFAFFTELVHSVVGKYIYNFQPLLTRTEVYKTAVTHYFNMKKARDHLGYKPLKYSLDGVIRHFKRQGHGRCKPQSSLVYYLVNVIIGLVFAFWLLSWLPVVDTCRVPVLNL